MVHEPGTRVYPQAEDDSADRGVGSLGVRLKAARRAKGLTQAELAEPEYSVAYVSRIESGERTPSPEALAVFAQRLGISPEALLSPLDDAALVRLETLRVSAVAGLDAGEWQSARDAARDLLVLAAELGSSRHVVDAHRVLGDAEEKAGDLEHAVTNFEAALAAVPSGSLEEFVDLTIRLAKAHRRLGDLGHSADLLERCLERIQPEAELHPALLARLLLNLSATSTERGDFARARRLGLEGVEFARKADDTRTLAQALWAAAPPMAVADPARALSLIRRAGTLYAELGLTVELGRLHAEMGWTALAAGDLPTARVALDRALELMGRSVTPSALSTILLTRAELEQQEGNLGEAAALAEQVIALAEGVEPLEQARARRVLGEAIRSQDPEAAERELRAAIELFTSAGAQMDTARCFRSLGDLLIAQGRSDEALGVFRDGLGVVEGAA